MKKIGIFYGPTGGSTEKVATMIKEEFGDVDVTMYPISDHTATFINHFEVVIFGCSTLGSETWNGKSTKSDWDLFRPEFDKLTVSGKIFALYGTGNHLTYPRNFVDSMGILGKILLEKDATIIGQCPTSDYEFTESEAVINGEFIGLPIDEDFEASKTTERVKNWVIGLKKILF